MSAPWDALHLAAGSKKPEINPDEVVVYNMRYCPFAQRTILVLLAKKIPFKVFNINLKQKPDWFVAETWGAVSVVLHRGNVLPESIINSDYLDEAFPETRLHPVSPAQKAKDRLVLEKYSKMIGPYYQVLRAANAEARDAPLQAMNKVLLELNSELETRGSKFFCGETAGMLDYMVWPWMERMEVLHFMNKEVKFAVTKALDAWKDNMWKTDAVSQYGISTENHCAFYKQYAKKRRRSRLRLQEGQCIVHNAHMYT